MRVDFYLLEESGKEARHLLACRLIEKAYLRGHKIFVYCTDIQTAETLDELLWTFKAESFIPHHIQGEGPVPPPPVQIGCAEPEKFFSDILLNMTDTLPPFFQKFKRIAEIVPGEEEAKEASRVLYREYRKHQCQLHTHPM